MGGRGRRVLLVTGLLLMLEAPGAWSGEPGAGASARVQIGDEALTAGELQELARRLPRPLQANLGTEPGRRKAMDWIIDWTLLLAEAHRSGVEREPGVQARLAAARERIVVAEYVKRLVRERVVVAEAEVEAYYATHRDEFTASEAIRLSQILVRTDAEAQAIQRDLAEGADFGRLARERSVDPSRRNDGQLGWVERRVLDPDLATAVFPLAAGATRIVHTRLGHHVIRVDETRPPEFAEYGVVKARIRDNLERQRARELMQEVAQELRGRARIEIDAAALEALQTDSRGDANAAR